MIIELLYIYILYVYIYTYTYILVGGIRTPLKNMKVTWDAYSQHMEKIIIMVQTTNQCR